MWNPAHSISAPVQAHACAAKPETGALALPVYGAELWTVADLAAFAKLSPSKIYRDAEAGLIPCRRWGRLGVGKKPVLRFLPSEILAWLDAGCPLPVPSKALVAPKKGHRMAERKTVGLGVSL